MNIIADQLQKIFEESCHFKECAVVEQDFTKAVAIRDWGDRLLKLIAEARQIAQTDFQNVTAKISPFIKQGKPRFAIIPTLNGNPLSGEFTITPDGKPVYYHSEGELDLTEVENALRFDLTFRVQHPAGWENMQGRYPEERCNGLTFLRYDGSGDLCESWVLKKVRVKSIQDEGEVDGREDMDLHQYSVMIEYGLPIVRRSFKEFDLPRLSGD